MTEDTDAVRTFGGGDGRDAWAKLRDPEYSDDRTEKATTSQQHDTDDPHTQVEWYTPPYPPTNLALLLERSETHKACVHAKAQGVSGYGFSIVPHEQTDADSPPGEETIREFWHGADSTFQLGPDEQPASPAAVLEQSEVDYQSIGYSAIEILLNDTTATPTGLAHVPAHTIRKRRGDPGYVQVDPDTDIIEGYYAPAGARFGDKQVFIDADDGSVGSSVADVDTPANELLVERNYSALAPHYGIPDIVPAMQTLLGDIAARQYNVRFFENDAIPRFAVIVEGGELTEDAWTELEAKFDDLRADENSHRGVILEAVSGAAASFEDAHNVSLRIEPLTVGVEEDASFIEYRKENEHDILKAHAVPPVIANRTESVNYANAEAQRQEFAQSTVRPRQQQKAARLFETLHRTMLGVDGWTIDFHLHGGENEERQAKVDKLRIEGTAGVMTVDEARQEIGKEPLGAPLGNMLVSELTASNALGGETDDDSVDEADTEAAAPDYAIPTSADD
ncbi:phage portal protein [Halomarina rubra]|uniref:Phage portal protein n=1 Tax=Halomarina rubra TaxID=2071873 RepID=A0ABD6B249_9EURY|nr:phage portal protein [Halomarina rubra]